MEVVLVDLWNLEVIWGSQGEVLTLEYKKIHVYIYTWEYTHTHTQACATVPHTHTHIN